MMLRMPEIPIPCRAQVQNRFRTLRHAWLWLLAIHIACLHLLPGHALAGGGPEKVLLVVNGDSAVSMHIANMYIELRDIPPEHVFWLHDIPYPERISLDTFRTRIWKPVREFITENRLDEEIDIIAYSSGFPHYVDISRDVNALKLANPRYHGNEAALTGLTYFARHVEKGNPDYLAGNANRYFRRNLTPRMNLPGEPTDAEADLGRKAKQAFREKDYPAAIAAYESLVRGMPGHGGLWHKLARAHAAAGNTAQAIPALQQAVNYGWTNSLATRSDRHLKTLSGDPEFKRLLDRMEQGNGPFQPAHGFSANYEWTGATEPVRTFGSKSLNSYYLSTMLAYTGINGNGIEEVENYLTAASSSDGSRPEGTVYLMVNRNVRSKTRQPLFLETAAGLQRRGLSAEILEREPRGQNGILPLGRDDVIGVVAGSAKFNWQASGSRLLPGAIAESLTSFGGRFTESSQTKLTEFLRHGAAGSSGAVTEPFSIQAKFPVPLMHVHYADGCSLAEAFYQSVESPYQLLIVGDPLARPYARFAGVSLASPDPGKPWSGVVTLQPAVEPAPDRPVDQLELWIDGQLTVFARPDEPVRWDTRNSDDGYHELRLVARESDAVETRSYARVGVTVANSTHRLEVNPPDDEVRYDRNLGITGTAAGATQVSLWQGSRKLATAPVSDGRWKLDTAARSVGPGPVSLGVRASFEDGTVVRSDPVRLRIAPAPVAGKVAGPQQPDPETGSPDSEHAGEAPRTVVLNGKLRTQAGTERLTLEGQVTIRRSGLYELVIASAGEISLAVDERPLLDRQVLDRKRTWYIPVALSEGTHQLDIEFSPADRRPYLKLVLEGDQAAITPEVRIVRKVSGKPAGARPQRDDRAARE